MLALNAVPEPNLAKEDEKRVVWSYVTYPSQLRCAYRDSTCIKSNYAFCSVAELHQIYLYINLSGDVHKSRSDFHRLPTTTFTIITFLPAKKALQCGFRGRT